MSSIFTCIKHLNPTIELKSWVKWVRGRQGAVKGQLAIIQFKTDNCIQMYFLFVYLYFGIFVYLTTANIFAKQYIFDITFTLLFLHIQLILFFFLFLFFLHCKQKNGNSLQNTTLIPPTNYSLNTAFQNTFTRCTFTASFGSLLISVTVPQLGQSVICRVTAVWWRNRLMPVLI